MVSIHKPKRFHLISNQCLVPTKLIIHWRVADVSIAIPVKVPSVFKTVTGAALLNYPLFYLYEYIGFCQPQNQVRSTKNVFVKYRQYESISLSISFWG